MTVRRDGGSWMFVIDLPRGEDGKRRQMRRRGFATQAQARQAEREANLRHSGVQLNADGSVAAELAKWLDERELDMSVTGVATYRDHMRA